MRDSLPKMNGARITRAIYAIGRKKGEEFMQKLAFCGNDCAVCPRYTATQSSDVLKLNAVAKFWNQLGWREAIESPEKIMCYGCSSSSFCRYGIQQCATENAVDNCGKCQGYLLQSYIQVV